MDTRREPQEFAAAIESARRDFIQVPGPNPILVPGPAGSWDEGVIECCDILKDHDTYYLYYHGTSKTTGYQLGVATASHPLGPWRKWEQNPVLRVGPPGSWEDRHVACAAIVKESLSTYLMYYSGRSTEDRRWHVGLAVGPSPLGPWEKVEGNPVLEDFGYVGGVVCANGRWHLYTEHPIGATGEDYGPISLATADSPRGPWTPHEGGPVLLAGEPGDWDDGGFSEAKVIYREGIFHLFYGGAKLHPQRMLTRESIGYAWSLDGVRFVKHRGNPVAPREANPDGAAFAEVHALLEPPLVYAYHTLRYNSRDGAEDLGVQVLARSRPFRLAMPLLEVAVLPAGAMTDPEACRPLSLAQATTCALTVECTGDAEARTGVRLHVRASTDGLVLDTEDLRAFYLPCRPGQTVRATFELEARVLFAKVLVENLNQLGEVRGIQVTATVGG